MKTPDVTTLNSGPATLFQLAARLEVPAGAGREKPAPPITAHAFAELRREAGSSPLTRPRVVAGRPGTAAGPPRFWTWYGWPPSPACSWADGTSPPGRAKPDNPRKGRL